MGNPSVCCVMLTTDRQSLADRAVRSFLAQDYSNSTLLVYDTGKVPYVYHPDAIGKRVLRGGRILPVRQELHQFTPIGTLRNMALWTASHYPFQLMSDKPDIICHFDDDDWSAPTRISEQVMLLQESKKQAVGYKEMLFWKRPATVDDWKQRAAEGESQLGQAWLYHNSDPRYIIDTSLCFWLATWEAKKFPECHIGEGREWIKGLDTMGVETNPVALHCDVCGKLLMDRLSVWKYFERTGNKRTSPCPRCGRSCPLGEGGPLMLAEIHGGNTTTQSMNPMDINSDGVPYWRRVPEWDERVREILEGA